MTMPKKVSDIFASFISTNLHFPNPSPFADFPKFRLWLFAFGTFDNGKGRAYQAARLSDASRVDEMYSVYFFVAGDVGVAE